MTDVDEAYQKGYKQGLLDIRRELDFCAAHFYKFPVLHVYKFIDEKLKKKQE